MKLGTFCRQHSRGASETVVCDSADAGTSAILSGKARGVHESAGKRYHSQRAAGQQTADRHASRPPVGGRMKGANYLFVRRTSRRIMAPERGAPSPTHFSSRRRTCSAETSPTRTWCRLAAPGATTRRTTAARSPSWNDSAARCSSTGPADPDLAGSGRAAGTARPSAGQARVPSSTASSRASRVSSGSTTGSRTSRHSGLGVGPATVPAASDRKPFATLVY